MFNLVRRFIIIGIINVWENGLIPHINFSSKRFQLYQINTQLTFSAWHFTAAGFLPGHISSFFPFTLS
jgi:hypothetical protein